MKKENYPDYPIITFNSFLNFCNGATVDSAYLRLNFTDGNGAIGYPQSDESAPSDFFVITLMNNKITGKFDTIKQPNAENTGDTVTVWAYKIPYITPSGSDKELNGIIQINLETSIQNIRPTNGHNYQDLEFVVWMYDRNGNKSNILNTGPVSTACQ